MSSTVQSILASIVMFEEADKSQTYSFLNHEDVRENLHVVRQWIKPYPKDGDLKLVWHVLAQRGICFRGALIEYFNSIPGSECDIVALQQLSETRPARGGMLDTHLDTYAFEHALEAVTDGINGIMNSRQKGTPKDRFIKYCALVQAERGALEARAQSGMRLSTMNPEQEKLMVEGARLTKVMWPLPTIQKTLKGVFEKSLNFIAAPQGSYKSRLMVQMAAIAVLGGQNVAYVSAEMAQEEIMRNIVFAIMGVWPDVWEGTKWHQASLDMGSVESLQGAIAIHRDFYEYIKHGLSDPDASGFGALFVMDTTHAPGLLDVIEVLEEEDRRMVASSSLDEKYSCFHAVFLDYLGIFDVPKEVAKKSQDEKGEWLAGTCKKKIAMGFCGRGVPVISAHQVNREGQKRSDAKGDMIRSYDMAGSGWIERYADSCVVLKKVDARQVKVHTVKSRRSEDVEPYLCTANHARMSIEEGAAMGSEAVALAFGGALPLEG